ncbi:MAG TPA: YlmC/YmxH family sporulation protein [Firmicutes bacterium]|nr:YlmC/YmxH family sporulation protein [Bacillota bacterium]
MFLTELAGKMVVNLQDGEVLGDVGDADLLIDETTGEILSILMPVKSTLFNRWFDRSYLTIEWSAVRKVGKEVIVVDLGQDHSPLW